MKFSVLSIQVYCCSTCIASQGTRGLRIGYRSNITVLSGIARECCPSLRRNNKMNQSIGEVRCANASCKCRDTAVPLGKHSSWMTDQRRKNGQSGHEMMEKTIAGGTGGSPFDADHDDRIAGKIKNFGLKSMLIDVERIQTTLNCHC